MARRYSPLTEDVCPVHIATACRLREIGPRRRTSNSISVSERVAIPVDVVRGSVGDMTATDSHEGETVGVLKLA